MDDDNNGGARAISSSSLHSEPQREDREEASDNGDQRVYLVPFRWWKEAQDSSSPDVKKGIPYAACPSSLYGGPMKIFNNIFSSDIAFNLRKEDALSCNAESDEAGESCRDYALVPGDMWLEALKWHSNSKSSSKERKGFTAAEDDMSDVYPLQLRLSVLWETNVVAVKVTKKENSVECFRRACKIFNMEAEPIRVWDFSGQTTLLLLTDKNKNFQESQKQTEQDLLLELQVYGLSDSLRNRGAKKDDAGTYSYGTSYLMNGSTTNSSSSSARSSSCKLLGNSFEAGTLGLTGLQNLGNTCFMNSALQCLAHTPKLVDYFLGDYKREINSENPLGMKGEIASSFGDLMKKLWAPGATPLAPRTFKLKLAHFAPQFSGFNQHDSQELLAFLLDGLHEDLNRVKCKPYVEAKDADDRPDEVVADEYWKNHLARNDSIIVDICQGQYRSTLACPICRKVSVTFDPFMYLSLPLPSSSMRTMTLTVIKADGSSKPSPFTVTVPKNGKFEDLIQALSTACSLGVDETFLVAEIYNNRIIRFLEEPTDSLSLIRDNDQLIAYRLPKDDKEAPLFVFMHQLAEEKFIAGKLTLSWRAFGVPLVSRRSFTDGSDIRATYAKLIAPFRVTYQESGENIDKIDISDTSNARLSGSPDTSDKKETDADSGNDFQFHFSNEKGSETGSEIGMGELEKPVFMPERLYVLVSWSDKMVKLHNVEPLNLLPEVFKSGFFTKRPQESISLYKCLEAFLKEEPLGPDDMWYCPVCKKHCQAGKKLDLWRLPEVLVIHLKRFSYSRFLKNKLETYVDFPIHDLDLSGYITQKDEQSPHRYMLYAISNHYGSMGGGHYTAFVHHGGDRWYDFDDSHVSPISVDKIKTSAAYVLFYRRVEIAGPNPV
ncbi:ubiquitin-specific protease 8 [Striga hermonthica]|uniref:Ubiquitin carboxyl-terminal hydrolase n=1 Tax=Striga hermonthica TaxID=68872 RepID=A0A9N7RL61_STRHE|nr:ubiquitin-specific protease 8 [Striga hermonthica]